MPGAPIREHQLKVVRVHLIWFAVTVAAVATTWSLTKSPSDILLHRLGVAVSDKSSERVHRLMRAIEVDDVDSWCESERVTIGQRLVRWQLESPDQAWMLNVVFWKRLGDLELLDLGDWAWWQQHVRWEDLNYVSRNTIVQSLARAAMHQQLPSGWDSVIELLWQLPALREENLGAAAHLAIASRGLRQGLEFAAEACLTERGSDRGVALIAAMDAQWLPASVAKQAAEEAALAWVKKSCGLELSSAESEMLTLALASQGWPKEVLCFARPGQVDRGQAQAFLEGHGKACESLMSDARSWDPSGGQLLSICVGVRLAESCADVRARNSTAGRSGKRVREMADLIRRRFGVRKP